jgi:hypothetical protein
MQEQHQSRFLPNGGITYDNAEAFGDVLKRKQACSWSAGLQNVNLLAASTRHVKSWQLITHIREAELNVFFMNEAGLNWAKLEACDQWAETAMGLRDGTAIFATNTTEQDISNKLQHGGVGTAPVTGETKRRIVSRGEDPAGMASWAWMRMEDEEGHHIRLVRACRPCKSGGASAVFQQHTRAMAA